MKREVSVYIKEYQAYVEDDPDEEEMDYFNLDNKREGNWGIVFEDND